MRNLIQLSILKNHYYLYVFPWESLKTVKKSTNRIS